MPPRGVDPVGVVLLCCERWCGSALLWHWCTAFAQKTPAPAHSVCTHVHCVLVCDTAAVGCCLFAVTGHATDVDGSDAAHGQRCRQPATPAGRSTGRQPAAGAAQHHHRRARGAAISYLRGLWLQNCSRSWRLALPAVPTGRCMFAGMCITHVVQLATLCCSRMHMLQHQPSSVACPGLTTATNYQTSYHLLCPCHALQVTSRAVGILQPLVLGWTSLASSGLLPKGLNTARAALQVGGQPGNGWAAQQKQQLVLHSLSASYGQPCPAVVPVGLSWTTRLWSCVSTQAIAYLPSINHSCRACGV